ncbi:MAG TPA: hypothetical protein VM307_05640 [Egibacteraceae bacterium]|nr:hypothetical protein [Egibacteraceae bacterium]
MSASRLRAALVAGALAVTSLSMTAPASAADFAEDCVDGPASAASAEAPHIWDAGGDSQFAPNADAADLRAGWIGVNEEGGFTANIQVTSMSTPPLMQQFMLSYSGVKGEHYVSARYAETGWAFNTGHLDTTQTPQRQVNDGPTTGSVDTAAGIITINLPEAAVPPAPTDGSEVKMPVIGMKSQQLLGTNTSGGLLLLTDDANWVCDVILYEAQETEEEPATDPSQTP